MAQHARELGWKQVEVIDVDLGSSASIGAAVRDGYEHTVAQVTMGEVGIVLSRELSRLSRTDKDWCHLMEVCQVFDTLVADEEQVYDLSLMDDQLVVGIKGTLSVVELKVLQKRLVQGQEKKARRGELFRVLPPGYVLDADGKVVKDPNRRVQQAIELVFDKFRELWSIRQTFLWFHNQGVELPVNKSARGQWHIVWQLPTHSFVSDVLHNAFYAGAYVYGRREREVALVDGRLVKRQGRQRSPEEARVFLRDHHQGYIRWETYEDNQRKIRSNALKVNSAGDETVGAVRSGHGLLQGLVRCRRCGRKLHVRYWGKHGTAARYLCRGDFNSGGRYCLGFGPQRRV
jgi:DNA invertase Pin-like site-specific DNA recombinase